ncbi:MAG: hypothetical protein JSS98_10050 [Bacteroidetes bacterium]|nr:hypothetical protein [Bacteroidota bacterium]
MSTVIKVENLSKQYRLGNVGLGTIGADFNRWWQTAKARSRFRNKLSEQLFH